MKLMLLRVAIGRALRRPVPNPIPRSGDRGAAVNGYVVFLRDPHSSLDLIVEKIGNRGISGSTLDGDTYCIPVSIPNFILVDCQITIHHYYGLWQFSYQSPLWFFAHQFLWLPQLTVLFDRCKQALFNRKRLVRMERMEVLKALVEKTIHDSTFSVSHIGLISEIHTHRWMYHPSRDSALQYYKLILESLQKSGDLDSVGGGYKVSSKALETLAKYEEEDRRHRDNVKQKRALNLLTLVLVLVGVAQVWVR